MTGTSLTAALRRLERNGIVERVVLDALLAWSRSHMADVDRARNRFDRT